MATKKDKQSKKNKAKKVLQKKNIKAKNSSPVKTKGTLIPLAVVLLLTFIAFAQTMNYEFVNWDDPVNVYENPNLVSFDWPSIKAIFTDDVIGNYNPLPIFTFAIERTIVQFEPFLYHFDNIIFHLICTFLVFRVFLLMKLSPIAAAIGALLFGIHPMRVESVAWVTERKDLVYGLFFLWGLAQYIKYVLSEQKKSTHLIFAFILMFFSCLGKIQAVSLPLSMLAIDYYFKRKLDTKLILEKIPFFALSLFFGVLGIYMLKENKSLDDTTGFGFPQRLLIGAYSYIVYLIKLVFPYEMSALYPYPKKLDAFFYVAPIGIVAIFGGLFMAWRKNWKAIVFGFAFFTVNVMFLLQVLSAGQGFIADRFTYIAYIGLFFIVAWGYDKVKASNPDKVNIYGGAMVAYFALCMFMTMKQNTTWKNGDTLWTNVTKYYTSNTALPYSNRALYHRENGDMDKALRDFTKALTINPKKASTLNSRGKLYFDTNKLPEALVDYNKAIENDPKLSEAYANRGATFARMGDNQKAMADFNKCIELDPEFKNGYLNRSLLYAQAQQYDMAIKDYDSYLKLDRYNTDIIYESGMALRVTGNAKAALTLLFD